MKEGFSSSKKKSALDGIKYKATPSLAGYIKTS